MKRRYRTEHGKDSPTDNAIRRWLNQLQETGCVVAAMETATQQMLEEHLDILRAIKDAHIDVV
jgi:hypothetical protein